MEDYEIIVNKIVVHPDFVQSAYYAYIDTPRYDILTSEYCDKNTLYFLPAAQFLGAIPVRERKKEMGVCIINTYAVISLTYAE